MSNVKVQMKFKVKMTKFEKRVLTLGYFGIHLAFGF
jgi:hypothetical protein